VLALQHLPPSYDVDLNGFNNQQITSIMGPTAYTPVSI
jgi:hypothetical protein